MWLQNASDGRARTIHRRSGEPTHASVDRRPSPLVAFCRQKFQLHLAFSRDTLVPRAPIISSH